MSTNCITADTLADATAQLGRMTFMFTSQRRHEPLVLEQTLASFCTMSGLVQ